MHQGGSCAADRPAAGCIERERAEPQTGAPVYCAMFGAGVGDDMTFLAQVSPADDDRGMESVLTELKLAKAALHRPVPCRSRTARDRTWASRACCDARQAAVIQRTYVNDAVPAPVTDPKLEVRPVRECRPGSERVVSRRNSASRSTRRWKERGKTGPESRFFC
jgi:hypothetical protein